MSELLPFQRVIGQWAAKTFPGSTVGTKIAHLRRELKELEDCPTDGEEMADCLLILLHIADDAGVDLLAAAKAKHEKNLRRTWGKPDAEGVVSHIPEAAE